MIDVESSNKEIRLEADEDEGDLEYDLRALYADELFEGAGTEQDPLKEQ